MMLIVDRLPYLCNRAFFSAEPALNLACARVILAAHALWVLLSRDLPAISALPAEFWLGADRTELWRYLIFPGHPSLEYGLEAVTVITLLLAILGIVPRLACFVSALLLYHLAPLETIYWTPNPYQRGFTVSVLTLFTLSFSRCGDALRLGESPITVPSAIYCWPLRLVQLHLAEVYFFSGTSKLTRVGVQWLDPENLRSWFLLFAEQDQVRRLSPVFNTVGPWIAEHWLLCFVAGLYGVVANLCFVAVPFSRYARRLLVPDAFLFHIMVLLSLNIFWINAPQLLVFVNWQWLVTRLKGKTATDAGKSYVRAERLTSSRATG
jgi:hypothetical protein